MSNEFWYDPYVEPWSTNRSSQSTVSYGLNDSSLYATIPRSDLEATSKKVAKFKLKLIEANKRNIELEICLKSALDLLQQLQPETQRYQALIDRCKLAMIEEEEFDDETPNQT